MDSARRIGERVLELLSEIDLERPLVDEELAADRLRAYVEALGLQAPDVRFFPDVRALREARVYPAEDRGDWPAFTGRQTWLLDRPTDRTFGWMSRGWETVVPQLAPPRVELERLANVDRTVLAVGLGRSRYVGGVRRVTEDLHAVARVLSAGGASRPKRVEALVPLAEAAAAGVFALAVGKGYDGDLVALLRPRMRLDGEGRLHDWDGLPSAEWENGRGLYFWHGVEMTQSAGRCPSEVTPSRVLRWANAERRRVAIERMGIDVFMKAVGAQVVQQDDYGRLWRTKREVDGEPFVAVEVVNATAELDGTRRTYFLRVPPSTRSARRAVAWTFGLTRRAYEPVTQS